MQVFAETSTAPRHRNAPSMDHVCMVANTFVCFVKIKVANLFSRLWPHLSVAKFAKEKGRNFDETITSPKTCLETFNDLKGQICHAANERNESCLSEAKTSEEDLLQAKHDGILSLHLWATVSCDVFG